MAEYTKPYQFGIPDRMTGDKCPGKRDEVAKIHPLSDKKAPVLFSDEAQLRRVRADFGLHMALRLAMERQIVSGAMESQTNAPGHRLHTGCLPPSHALVSSLIGRDLEFGFQDVLNTTEFSEPILDPHNFCDVDKKPKKPQGISEAFI